jgi:predicted MFS family arabinose efflux permease
MASAFIVPHPYLRPVFVGAIIFLLGGVLQTAAVNREMMLAGRFFAGLSIGMLVSSTSRSSFVALP